MDQTADNEKKLRIAIIDDDHTVLQQAMRIFTARGYQLLPLAHAIGSANQIRKFAPHLIVLDVTMPAINGDELFALLRRILKNLPPVIFYSGIDPDELKRLASDYKAADYAYKGDGMLNLLNKVNLQLQGRK